MFRNTRSILRWYQRRGFRTKQNASEISENSFTIPGLTKPFLFTISVCSCSFCGAMIWQYENMRIRFKDRIGLDNINKSFYKQKKFALRDRLNLWWNDYSPGEKVVLGIIACNLGIFLLWQVPAMRQFMTNYFTSSPLSSAPCWSLLLSVFSHQDLWHFAINMYCFKSFTPDILELYGKEQFLAFYISAGVVASFAGFALKLFSSSPIIGSLGASGAIMATIGSICMTHPDHKLTIAFIGPLLGLSFTADAAMKGIIALDVIGLLLGWKLFDHAAHLGGMLFGIWYVKYGQNVIWGNREYLMKKWHRIRGPPS